jgi:hypothetical protein
MIGMKKSAIVIVAVSLFIGLMVASVGGAVVPSVLRVTAPFVCPDGQFEIVSQRYSGFYPGVGNTYGVTRSFYCVDESAGPRSVGLAAFLVGTVVYAIAAYAAIALITFAASASRQARRQSTTTQSGDNE